MSTIPNTGIYRPSEWGQSYHSRRENEVFGAGAAGPGKALALDTLVPTPIGFRLLKDIKPGETVFNVKGEQVKVLAESEILTDRPCYRLTICKEVIIADANHIWCLEGGVLKTTKEIHESPFRFAVVAAEPAWMEKRHYLLDPYVLGICLMIGQPKDRSKFTTWDPELYSILKDIGYTLDDVGYKIAQIRERKDLINELIPEDNRRIPHDYFLGSFNQRMALVEGIMDGNKGRGPTVSTADSPFVVDFYCLCASLGLGPVITRSFKYHTYSINIQSRKHRCSRRIGGGAKKKEKRSNEITRIERCISVPTKCIQVSGGGTFLITKSYIPTHNSMVLLADPLEQVWVEHLRCQQDKVPESFPGNIKQLIEQHPIKWGYSEGWILHLRRTMPRLTETINRAHRMFPQIDPDVQWSEKKSTFTFSSGIKYEFGHCKDRTDYNNYLGKQYCLAEGEPIVMADGSPMAIEKVRVGDLVATLQGPKRVTHVYDTGVRPCVSASVLLPDGTFETSVFPTTHSVHLWPNVGLLVESSEGYIETEPLTDGLSNAWIDYESLLCVYQESKERLLGLADGKTFSSESCAQFLSASRLEESCVPVVLHGPSVRRFSPTYNCLKVDGVLYEKQNRGITKDLTGHCSFLLRPHGELSRSWSRISELCVPQQVCAGQLDQSGHNSDAPRSAHEYNQISSLDKFCHFYTGQTIDVTEETHRGWAKFRFVGLRKTFDITVEHGNHYVNYNNALISRNSYLGWDELVEFNKEQYDFISSRLRTGDVVLRHFLKNRSMSNPRLSGNKGEDISIDDPAWVKRYFVDPWPDGRRVLTKRIKRRDGSTELVTRLYLPATLYDNPDPEFVRQYELQLMSRPKHIRDCYLYGRWDTVVGSHFGEDWNPTVHVCKPFKIPPNWPIFRAMDWGFKTAGNVGWYTIHPEGTLYKFFEITFSNKTATEVAERLIKPFEEKNKLWDSNKGSLIYGPADNQIWEERGESARTKYQEFVEVGIDWCKADKKSRQDNAETFHSLLRSHENYTKLPGIVFFENCKNSIQVIPAMETDPNKPEEPKKGGFDHPYDETSYACRFALNEGLQSPNYKGKIVYNDDFDGDIEETEDRGNFGYWGG